MIPVHVGHINLAPSFNGAGEHFVGLIESLQKHAVRQYVLVRNVALAKRLDAVDGVTVGPVVRSAVSAYCLMPSVDIVHIHDESSQPAGLLFALTRSIPFVLTQEVSVSKTQNPIQKAAYRRAAGFVDEHTIGGAAHLSIYHCAIKSLRLPTLIL